MKKFRSGDKVRCVDASPSKTIRFGKSLIQDKIYTIEFGLEHYVWLKETNRGPPHTRGKFNDYYSVSRFRHVVEEEQPVHQPKFKVGDRVIWSNHPDVVYSVTGVRCEHDKEQIEIVYNSTNGSRDWWNADNFKLAPAQKEKATYKVGDEVWVKATVTHYHSPEGTPEKVTIKFLDQNSNHWVNTSSIMRHIPKPPKEIKVGSKVEQGVVESISGNEAWILLNNTNEHPTYEHHTLKIKDLVCIDE